MLCTMRAREADGNEPPATVAGGLAAADAFIAPSTKSLSLCHIRAREAARDNILETAHGAFGACIGRNVSVAIHLDSVVLDPTLDGISTRVLDAGRLVLG